MQMPENRWILWADGPLRGPAVRFWTILVVAILAALALGSTPLSPLRRYEWILLAIGLTQVHLILADIGRRMVVSSRLARQQRNHREVRGSLIYFKSASCFLPLRASHPDGRCGRRAVGQSGHVCHWQWFLGNVLAMVSTTQRPRPTLNLRALDLGLVLSVADVVLGVVVSNRTVALVDVGLATVQQWRSMAKKTETSHGDRSKELESI